MKLKHLAAVALAFVGSAVAHANLVVNGGFESPNVLTGSAGSLYGYNYRPNGTLPGWTSSLLQSGIVQFDGIYRPVDQGSFSVQLESGVRGVWAGDTLYQSFATTPGASYKLTFDLSAYDAGGAILGVSVGNLSTSLTGSNLSWVGYSYVFQANASLSTLTFQNLGKYAISYPHLDEVSVSRVPDGGLTLSLLGVGLAGVGLLRRKLG